jgi:hypothetical protein
MNGVLKKQAYSTPVDHSKVHSFTTKTSTSSSPTGGYGLEWVRRQWRQDQAI